MLKCVIVSKSLSGKKTTSNCNIRLELLNQPFTKWLCQTYFPSKCLNDNFQLKLIFQFSITPIHLDITTWVNIYIKHLKSVKHENTQTIKGGIQQCGIYNIK